jgi:hypothetical protein
MEKNKPSSKKKLSAREMVLQSKYVEANLQKVKGKLYSDALMLLFKKVGITEREIKELNVQSVRNNQKIAKQFAEDIKANPLPVDKLMPEVLLSLEREKTNQGGTLRDLPIPAGLIRLQNDNPLKNLSHHEEASGDGLLESTITSTTSSDPFVFRFTAMDSADYRVTAPVITVGPYVIIADDGPCNDKFAILSAWVVMNVTNQNGVGSGDSAGLFGTNVITNDAIQNSLINGSVLENQTLFHFDKGDEITVSIQVYSWTRVKGGGSITDVNFTIWSPYIDVGWIGTL